MKTFLNTKLPIIVLFLLVASCSQVSKKVEDKLNELNAKAEQLDSLVNKEVEKVLTLDTLVNFETNKIKKLDSLINNSTQKLDSLTKGRLESIKNIIK